MPHTEEFKIRTSECDSSIKLKPSSILDLFQEAAAQHCLPHKIDTPYLLKTENKTWVLSGLTLEIDSYPLWPNTLRVDTWPRVLSGFKAIRDYRIHDSTNREIVRGTSSWALLDMNRRRPVKIDFPNLTMDIEDNLRAIEETPGIVKADPDLTYTLKEFKVTQSDIDVNGHVSNIKFMEWIHNHLERDAIEEMEISKISISYRGEALLGDEIIFKSSLKNNRGVHIFIHKGTSRELCIMNTNWRTI